MNSNNYDDLIDIDLEDLGNLLLSPTMLTHESSSFIGYMDNIHGNNIRILHTA